MKILGFNFDSRANACGHVEKLVEKFHSRLWTLRFLKRSGLEKQKLLELYNSVLRSTVEYCSVVYHSMIPTYLSDKLETLQRRALKIIYGWHEDIDDIMQIKGIQTLADRRENAVTNFAIKNEHVSKYGKKWFKETVATERVVRQTTRDKYVVPFCRTDRMKANPVVNMTKKLNLHYRN